MASILFLGETISVFPVDAQGGTPPGSASFAGHLYLDEVAINGATGYGMLGTMAMGIEFSGGPGSVTGTVTDVNLLRSGVPQQRMAGSLEILGTERRSVIAATATGELDVRGRTQPFSGSTEMALDLNGTTRGDFGHVVGVHGSAVGTGTGDFDVDVISGVFFGTRR
jgi:hypothetical protein